MDEIQEMTRAQLAVNDAVFFLAPNQDVDDLKRRIEDAAQTSGKFVEFRAVGDRRVSVLISSGSPVVLSVETVQFESWDADDLLSLIEDFDL